MDPKQAAELKQLKKDRQDTLDRIGSVAVALPAHRQRELNEQLKKLLALIPTIT